MEMDLKHIINKIKEEGVDEAEKQAADIIAKAKEEARMIAGAAEAQKKAIIQNAEKETEKLRMNAEESIRQASRDALLGLKEAITRLFDRVAREKVADELTPDVLKEMIVKLVDKFKEESDAEIEVLLSKKDKDLLEKTMFGELKKAAEKGVTLKVSDKVENGFLIGKKGEASYYDFTDDAIMEAFKIFLNPKFREILDTRG